MSFAAVSSIQAAIVKPKREQVVATETIPIVDLGPYLSGEPGAMDSASR